MFRYYPHELGYVDVKYLDADRTAFNPDQDATFYVEVYDSGDTLRHTFTLSSSPAIASITTGEFDVASVVLTSFATGIAYSKWYAKLNGVNIEPYPYLEYCFEVLAAVAGNWLCTLADLKAHLRITDANQDDYLEALITRTTAFVQSHCRREFKSTEHTEYYSGDGSPRLTLRHYPVTAVSQIKDDKSGQADFDFSGSDLNEEFGFESWGLVSLMGGDFFQPPGSEYPHQNYKLVYTAGYATVPEDVRQAAIEIAASMYYKSKHQKLGKATHTMGGETITYTADDLSAMQRRMLAPFRAQHHAGV